MKGIKLHELTPEKVGLTPVAPPPPDINYHHGKVKLPADPEHLTKEEAIMALRSAYRQLVKTNSTLNNKGIAKRLVVPALAYLESLTKEP